MKYNNETSEKVEVIFISFDASEEKYAETKKGMPWLSIKYSDLTESNRTAIGLRFTAPS